MASPRYNLRSTVRHSTPQNIETVHQGRLPSPDFGGLSSVPGSPITSQKSVYESPKAEEYVWSPPTSLSTISGSASPKNSENFDALVNMFDGLTFTIPHEEQPKTPSNASKTSPASFEDLFSSLSVSSSHESAESKKQVWKKVQYGQPFENLFDQFDKDPRVEVMIRGNAFAKEHYQTLVYPPSKSQEQPKPRVSCSSEISSLNSSLHGSPESNKEDNSGRLVLAPFSKASPSPIKNNKKLDRYGEHWFN